MMYGITAINSIYIVILVLAVPFIGGLLDSISRKVTARFQNKVGPHITQPYIDFIKLSMKQQCRVNSAQPVFIILHFLFALVAFTCFILGQDILKIIFIIVCSDLTLILGAAWASSPYSVIAAKREAMTTMVFMLMLVMIAYGIYLTTGGFMVQGIMKAEGRVMSGLPLLIYPLFFSLLLKMRKSPLDCSLSCGRHQELGGGITVEFSSRDLALVKFAKWFVIVTILGLSSMLFSKQILYGCAMSFVLFLAVILIDNITCRMSWQWIYKSVMPLGLIMMGMNFLWFITQ